MLAKRLSSKTRDCKLAIIIMRRLVIITGLLRGLLWEQIIDGWTAFSASEGRYYINPSSFFLLIIFPWRVPERKSLCGWMWIGARIEGGEKIFQGSRTSVFEVLLSECVCCGKLHLLHQIPATQTHCLVGGEWWGKCFLHSLWSSKCLESGLQRGSRSC